MKSRSNRVTIRDVAAEAKVSISTVSLYTRNRASVSEETGRRIQEAIDKLGYKPRPRRNSRKKQALFGLLIEELPLLSATDIIYNRILHTIEAQARASGYGMIFSVTEDDRIPNMVENNQVEGIMILGGSATNDALAMEIHRRGIPLVLVDNYVPDLQVDAIVPDNHGGGYLALKHLIDLGHERIAIIEGPRKYKTLTDRLEGALRAAEEFGLEIPSEYRQSSLSQGYPKKGYPEMERLLSLSQPPTAVFAVSDKTAFGALEAIRDAGMRVPEDVSIIGFDDIAEAAHTTPPLTTIHVPTQQIGELAFKRLLSLINGEAIIPTRTAVYSRLVVRQSTIAKTK